MSGVLFAWLARLHGLVAVLGLALLLHPVVTLWTRPRLGRWTQLTADLGALMLLAPMVLGLVIYPSYRAGPKEALLLDAPLWAGAFELKEHLGFAAVAMAVAGALALRAAGESPEGRRAAWAALTLAWACGTVAAVLGLGVAGVAHPGW